MKQLVITPTARRAILGVTALFLVAAAALGGIVRSGETVADGAGRGRELPTAAFELFDGGEATFAEFEGKPLVINFWASWCPACVAELPEFRSVHAEYGDQVSFLGLANTDRRDAAQSLAADVGLTYTLADDPRGELFVEFGLISMPSTIFVDSDGRIDEVFGGVLNEALLAERVRALVDGS